MQGRIAYITQGKLYLKVGDAAPQLIVSDFAQRAVAKLLQRQEKNSWKSGGGSALISGDALWGVRGDESQALSISFSGVTAGDSPEQLIYSLSTSAVGGLFLLEKPQGKEHRLFHKEKLWLRDLRRHPQESILVCSQPRVDGTASITICQGTDVQQVTEGDSVDESPSWVPAAGKTIVFQSAGVGRNKEGIACGIGPYSIQKLNLATGDMDELAADPKFDYLAPHMLANGDLLYIKRPYEPFGQHKYPLGKMFIDVIAFPYRLGRAVFHFLNFLSLMFSKKPLTTAGGPPREGLDVKQIWLRGRLIDTDKALKASQENSEPPPLVPSDWQLTRKAASGTEHLLACSVAAFDVDNQGRIIYTDGMNIYELSAEGKPTKIAGGNLIESVICLN